MSPKTQQVDVVFLVKNFRISEPQIHRNSSEAQTMSQENLNKNVKTYCRPVGMAPETTGQNDLITTTRNEKTHRNGNTKTLRAFTSSVPRNLESQTLPRMISTRCHLSCSWFRNGRAQGFLKLEEMQQVGEAEAGTMTCNLRSTNTMSTADR